MQNVINLGLGCEKSRGKTFGIKILVMTFFISPNTSLGVAKLHVFRIKILGTLGVSK
jgi:hypothetical protein